MIILSYISWDKQFNTLKLFYNENGHCKIPKKNSQYNWVCRQRMNKKDGILPLDKEELLLSIDFKFNESWEEMFDKFVVYFNKYKTLDISQDNEFYNELGSWIKRQIKYIKNSQLPKNKIYEYNKLGLLFDSKKTLEDIWFESYTELKNYYLINRDCKVPNTDEYKSLYRFIQTQRENYKNNKLSEDRIKLLFEINFTFSLWEDNYNNAKEYFLKNGNLLISSNNKDYKSIRNWIYKTRQDYKNDKLSKKQIDLLNEINFPFETNSKDKTWLNYYQKSKHFIDSGKPFYELSNDLYAGLFEWMVNQAVLYKNKKITNYKINMLNKINFDYSLHKYNNIDRNWIKNYLLLSKLFINNKSYYISYKGFEDIKLWIFTQCKNKELLNKNQIRLLKEIKFNFNLINELYLDYDWEVNFNLVENIVKEYDLSKLIINCSYKSIEWLLEQYYLYDNKLLSKYQMKLLKEINFNKIKRLYKFTDVEWLTYYKKLYSFYKTNNNYNINPFEHSEELFKWALRQCLLNNGNRLMKTKKNLLESIYFDFNIKPISNKDMQWLKYYNKLKHFRKNYGHFIVDDCGSFLKLYIWTKKQYNNYKHGKLENKYYNLLVKIRFPFDNYYIKNYYDDFSKLKIN